MLEARQVRIKFKFETKMNQSMKRPEWQDSPDARSHHKVYAEQVEQFLSKRR